MKLSEVFELSKKEGFQLMKSEEEELEKGQFKFFKELRDRGFYRVYKTYYIDYYGHTQFYRIEFINSQTGYRWLLEDDDDYNDDPYTTTYYDLYIVTKGDSIIDRKDRKVFTGTLQQILEYSKRKDKSGYKIAARQNEV